MKNIVRKCIFSLATLCFATGFGATMGVDYLQTDGVTVEKNQTATQADDVIIGDGGVFSKAGEGTLVLPLEKIEKSVPYEIRVLNGTLRLQPGDGFATAEPPECVASKAAFWVDASADNGTLVLDGNVVTKWCDRRETDVSSPVRYYAVPKDTGNGSEHVDQTYVHNDGTNAVYFGGYNTKNDRYMRFRLGADEVNVSKVRHAFVVHGAFECWCAPLGAVGDPTEMFGGASINQMASTQGHFIWYGHVMPASFTARYYLDGEKFDPWSVPPKKGFQLLEGDYIDYTAQFAAFYCMKTAAKRQGGDYLSEVILFTNELSAAERLDVERYLMRKWKLGADAGRTAAGTVKVAPDAVVEFAPSTDAEGVYSNLFVTGNGAVAKSGAGRLTVGAGLFRDFDGNLNLQGGGAVFVSKGVVPPLSLDVGDRITASHVRPSGQATGVQFKDETWYGQVGVEVVRTANAAGAGVIEKTGSENVTATALPSGVKTLSVDGDFTLRAPGTAAISNGCIMAEIPNADFELPVPSTGTYNRCLFNVGQYINGWTKAGGAVDNNGPVGYLLENDGDTLTGRGSMCAVPIRQGRQALLVCHDAAAYCKAYFPKSGYYVLDLMDAQRQVKYGAGADNGGDNRERFGYYAVKIGDTWATATERARHLANCGPFLRTRLDLGWIEAGEHVLGFQSLVPVNDSRIGFVLDDLKAYFVSDVRETGVVSIPNGNFENVTNDTVRSPYVFFMARTNANKAVGWTLAGGELPGKGPAVAATGAPMADYNTFRNGANSQHAIRMADVGDDMFGSVSLSFFGSAGSAATTFACPAGTWRLRGKMARWSLQWQDSTGTYNYIDGAPAVTATLTLPGGAVANLGSVTTGAHEMRTFVWPTSFTVAEAGDVTLQLAQTTSNGSCLVDDFELVADDWVPDSAYGVEILQNGSFETGSTGWSSLQSSFGDGWWPGVKDSHDPVENNMTPHQFGATAYDGRYYMMIPNNGGLTQDVTLEAGLYRFTFASHTRFTGGYDRNPIRAWVARNGVTNEIGRTFVNTTNDIEHVWQFRVETPGTYKFGIQGTEYWREQVVANVANNVNPKHHDSLVDGLSLARICEPAADVPSVPEKMKIRLSENSRLRLDFDGEITVGTVLYGGTGYAGRIDASTHPGFISGRGALNAVADGTLVIFR